MTRDEPMLRLIGLGSRAGRLTVGVEGTRAAIRRGRAQLVVLASDASTRTRDKVLGLAAGADVPVVCGPAADSLGARLGRPAVHAVAVTDRGISRGILECGVSAVTTAKE